MESLGSSRTKLVDSEEPVTRSKIYPSTLEPSLQGEGNIAAIVEGFFQCDAKIVFVRQFRHPAFDAFVDCAGRNFKFVGVCIRGSYRLGGVLSVHVLGIVLRAQTRVSVS